MKNTTKTTSTGAALALALFLILTGTGTALGFTPEGGGSGGQQGPVNITTGGIGNVAGGGLDKGGLQSRGGYGGEIDIDGSGGSGSFTGGVGDGQGVTGPQFLFGGGQTFFGGVTKNVDYLGGGNGGADLFQRGQSGLGRGQFDF